MRLGLIGYPLTHSFSPRWFAKKFIDEGIKGEYNLFPLPSVSRFPDLLKQHPELEGLNVTIPHKTAIQPFLDRIDPAAAAVGAVNTIVIIRERDMTTTMGFNTDAPGFSATLDNHRSYPRALILGTGGAASAVAHALQERGTACTFVSRNPAPGKSIGYDMLTRSLIAEHPLIINTTPLGMYPDVRSCPPLPFRFLDASHLLYDLVYNPSLTLFMKQGMKQGARAMNGSGMLHHQAELAFRIFRHYNAVST